MERQTDKIKKLFSVIFLFLLLVERLQKYRSNNNVDDLKIKTGR